MMASPYTVVIGQSAEREPKALPSKIGPRIGERQRNPIDGYRPTLSRRPRRFVVFGQARLVAVNEL